MSPKRGCLYSKESCKTRLFFERMLSQLQMLETILTPAHQEDWMHPIVLDKKISGSDNKITSIISAKFLNREEVGGCCWSIKTLERWKIEFGKERVIEPVFALGKPHTLPTATVSEPLKSHCRVMLLSSFVMCVLPLPSPSHSCSLTWAICCATLQPIVREDASLDSSNPWKQSKAWWLVLPHIWQAARL